MIEQGQMTEAGLVKIRQAKESGEWHNAASRETLEIPSDLEKELGHNKEARRNFKQLPPSRQKQLIWWVTSAKKEETRRRRINEIIRLVEEKNEYS